MSRRPRRTTGELEGDDGGSPSSSSSVEEIPETKKQTKSKRRRRELDDLLADQRKMASQEEMASLRGYVNAVLDHEEPVGDRHSRRHRTSAAAFSRVPNMFGVMVGAQSSSSLPHRAAAGAAEGDGGLPRRTAASASEDGQSEGTLSSVQRVDAMTFHHRRWLLGTCCSDNGGATGGGECHEWTPATRSEQHSAPRGDSKRFVVERRAVEDAEWLRRLQRGQAERCALHRSATDAVAFADAREFDAVIAYLSAAAERHVVAEGGDTAAATATATTTAPTEHEAWDGCSATLTPSNMIGLLKVLGFDAASAALTYYGDSRNVLVTHDRVAIMSSLSSSPTSRLLSYEGVMIVVHLCLFGVIQYRRYLLAQALALSKGTLLSVASMLSKIAASHPFAAERMFPAACSIAQPGSTIPTASDIETLTETGLIVLTSSMNREIDRRQQSEKLLHEASATNVALQRQEAKLAELQLRRRDLASRAEVFDKEANAEAILQEMSSMVELSRRYGEAVVSGIICEDRVCSASASFLMDVALWSLPPSVPHPLREVEEALEKYLWQHPYALMSDDIGTMSRLQSVRENLMVNNFLRRLATRGAGIAQALRKFESDVEAVVQQTTEEGVALPQT